MHHSSPPPARLIQTLIDSVPDLIFIKDVEGRYLACNAEFVRHIGRPSSDILGKTDYDIYPREEADAFRKNDALAMKQEVPRHNDEWITYPDGSRVFLNTIKTAHYDADGSLLGVLGISRDITDRIQTQEQIRILSETRRELLRLATDFLKVPVADQDDAVQNALQTIGQRIGADRVFIFRSDYTRHILCNTYEWCAPGIKPQIDQLQEQPMDLYPDVVAAHTRGEPVYIPRVEDLDPSSNLRAILEKQGIQSLMTLPLMNGESCLGFIGFDAVHAPRVWTREEIDLLQLVADLFTNLEARRITENALRRANEERAMLLDTMDTQVWYLSSVDTYGTANRAHADFLGVSPEKIAFQRLDAFLPPEEVALCVEGNRVVFEKGMVVHADEWIRRADGEQRLLSITKTPRLSKSGTVEYAVCTATDITESEQTREALRTSEKRYRGLIESQRALIVRIDTEGRLIFVNDAYCAAFGKSREELLGNTFFPLVHPDDLASTKEAMKGLYHPPWRITVEQRALTVEGWRWISWEDDAILDEEGCVTEIQGVGHDITELKQMHEELTAALEKANAAAHAKELFLANMSHEIRTPLNAVLGYAQLLTRKHGSCCPGIGTYLDAITRGGEHLLDLLDHILEVVKTDVQGVSLSPSDFTLQDLIESVCMMNRHRLHPEARFETAYAENLPHRLRADQGRIRQVLINLAGNAARFTRRGTIRLSTSIGPCEADGRLQVIIDIEDSGAGIAPDRVDAVFEPFEKAETERLPDQGAGLGLPLSRRYARAMNGDVVLLRNQPGAGCTFRFTFEAQSPRVVANGNQRPFIRLAPQRPAPLLLLVDDDPDNLDMLREMLEDTGFRVECVSGGEAAITRCTHSPMPDAILLDKRMPEMDGIETARRLREMPGCRDLPLLMVTADGEASDPSASNAVDGWLVKPLSRDILLEAIRSITGVRYETQAASGPPPGQKPPTRESIHALPACVVDALRAAVESGHLDQMRHIVREEIRPLSKPIADFLSTRIEQFDYATLLTLLLPSNERVNS